MQLPKKGFDNEDHIYLYSFDVKGYHNPDTYSFWRIRYLKHINEIIDAAVRYSKGKKVLEIGCAQANISTLLAEDGFDVVALDINPDFLTYAKMKYEFGSIAYIASSAEHLPFSNENFDVVIASELLEHLAFPEKVLMEVRRCLKKEGKIIITTPNGDCLLKEKLDPFSEAKDHRSKLKKTQFGPSGEDHLFTLTQKEVEGLLEELEFDVVSVKWIKSIFLNRFTQPLYRISPISFLNSLESIVVKIPILNRRLGTTLFVIAKK